GKCCSKCNISALSRPNRAKMLYKMQDLPDRVVVGQRADRGGRVGGRPFDPPTSVHTCDVRM
ncbi:MAG: hypothetical protein E6Y08_04415, partial [Paenibacillus sp.]|uniref:hypothetical protein n=1 Tax=Paenibacillus sp. TaxID=58172 RepID=UPI0029146DA6